MVRIMNIVMFGTANAMGFVLKNHCSTDFVWHYYDLSWSTIGVFFTVCVNCCIFMVYLSSMHIV